MNETLDLIDWYWGEGESFELPDHLDNKRLTLQCLDLAVAYGARPGSYGCIHAGHEDEEAYSMAYDCSTDEQI